MTDFRIPRPQYDPEPHPDDPVGWHPRGRLDGAPNHPEWMAPLLGAITDGTVHGMLPERTPPTDRGPNSVGRTHRYASVLVLLSGDPAASGSRPPADASVLLTHRAPTMNNHSGQVAFPGGRVDEGDTGPVDTALREAAEETGVDRADIDVFAILPDLYIPVSNYSVAAVLGYWREPGHVDVVDAGETARVMNVPLRDLLDPANRFVLQHTSGWKGPAFHLDDLVLWGFTAGILSAMFNAAGWDHEWDAEDVRDLQSVLEASANQERHSDFEAAEQEKYESEFRASRSDRDLDHEQARP